MRSVGNLLIQPVIVRRDLCVQIRLRLLQHVFDVRPAGPRILASALFQVPDRIPAADRQLYSPFLLFPGQLVTARILCHCPVLSFLSCRRCRLFFPPGRLPQPPEAHRPPVRHGLDLFFRHFRLRIHPADPVLHLPGVRHDHAVLAAVVGGVLALPVLVHIKLRPHHRDPFPADPADLHGLSPDFRPR